MPVVRAPPRADVPSAMPRAMATAAHVTSDRRRSCCSAAVYPARPSMAESAHEDFDCAARAAVHTPTRRGTERGNRRLRPIGRLASSTSTVSTLMGRSPPAPCTRTSASANPTIAATQSSDSYPLGLRTRPPSGGDREDLASRLSGTNLTVQTASVERIGLEVEGPTSEVPPGGRPGAALSRDSDLTAVLDCRAEVNRWVVRPRERCIMRAPQSGRCPAGNSRQNYVSCMAESCRRLANASQILVTQHGEAHGRHPRHGRNADPWHFEHDRRPSSPPSSRLGARVHKYYT